MIIEQGNGHAAGTPGWWRVDLAETPGLGVLPFCAGCTAAMATGYCRVTTFWGRLFLCDSCAGGLVARFVEVQGLEVLDKRTDIVLEVSKTDVTVTVIWAQGDDLATTEVIAWPAGGQTSAAQEAEVVDQAVTRLCLWLNGYYTELEADQPASELIGQ